MKITTGRIEEEATEVKRIIIYIGENKYRITESVDNKLTISKISDGISDNIYVHPRYANEIEIS